MTEEQPPVQLALTLPFKPAFDREDFLLSPANSSAVAVLENTAAWSTQCAILSGPPGSGKSHLAAVWCQAMDADLVTAQHLDMPFVANRSAQQAGPLVVEDVEQGLAAGLGETVLFHAMNDARERGQPLLFTASRLATQWGVALPDLASRLAAATVAQIAPPDDALLQAVLVKQLLDRRIEPPAAVIDYVLPRMERSFAGVRRLVAALDQEMLRQKRPLTRAVARHVLAQML